MSPNRKWFAQIIEDIGEIDVGHGPQPYQESSGRTLRCQGQVADRGADGPALGVDRQVARLGRRVSPVRL
jgi:hypothetical protein